MKKQFLYVIALLCFGAQSYAQYEIPQKPSNQRAVYQYKKGKILKPCCLASKRAWRNISRQTRRSNTTLAEKIFNQAVKQFKLENEVSYVSTSLEPFLKNPKTKSWDGPCNRCKQVL